VKVVDEDRRVTTWRIKQLLRLGVPAADAGVLAGRADIAHDVEHLVVDLHCPVELALKIVR
jgi:hypothetical protein